MDLAAAALAEAAFFRACEAELAARRSGALVETLTRLGDEACAAAVHMVALNPKCIWAGPGPLPQIRSRFQPSQLAEATRAHVVEERDLAWLFQKFVISS